MKTIKIKTKTGELIKEFFDVSFYGTEEFYFKDKNSEYKTAIRFSYIDLLNLNWELFEYEPEEKEPVIRWLWIYKEGHKYARSEGYYTEEEAANHFAKKFIRKIENTIEVFPE